MTVTEAEVIEALRPVQDPELHRSIVDLGMVRSTSIDGGHVEVGIDLTIAGCPLRNEIQTRVNEAVGSLEGVSLVTVDFGVMTDEQRAMIFEGNARRVYPRLNPILDAIDNGGSR